MSVENRGFPIQQSREREIKKLEISRFTPQERVFLNKLLERHAPKSILGAPYVLDYLQEELGQTITSEEVQVFDKIRAFQAAAGITEDSNLTFRFVTPTQYFTAEEIISNAEHNGGKSPHDSSIGICVDAGHKITKYIKENENNELVLFVYDQKKLTELSPQEKEDNLLLRFYGVKPKEGLTLRDALLGSIYLEAD